jgi:hypothetical protein
VEAKSLRPSYPICVATAASVLILIAAGFSASAQSSRKGSETQAKNIQFGDGMKRVTGVIGRKSDVAEAIRSITPAHPALKLVTHPQEQAYTLVSVPDEIARAFECRSQVKGVNAARKVGNPGVYGNYYGAIFELNIRGEPAALRLLWGKEKGQWQIIAYSIDVP